MLSRRQLLSGGAAGAVCLVAFRWPAVRAGSAGLELNAYVSVASNSDLLLVCPATEMGQGVETALPMILAEELEADWLRVRVAYAPLDARYDNPVARMQATAGSRSVAAYFEPLRRAGAEARARLLGAAARRWACAAEDCVLRGHAVHHALDGRRASLFDLAHDAVSLPAPARATPKPRAEHRLIGRPVPRLRLAEKVDGSEVYGIDVQLPGMLHASVRTTAAPATPGNRDAVLAEPGVVAVVDLPNGAAVVARSFWQAESACQRLQFVGERPAGPSSAGLERGIHGALEAPGSAARQDGDAAAAIAASPHRLSATYDVPFLAHAPMEPVNVTIHVREDAVEVWAPMQSPTATAARIASICGLPVDRVRYHQVLMGGSFGRKFAYGEIERQAALIGRAVGRPVKILWTREEDLANDVFRPMVACGFDAALGDDGLPVALQLRSATHPSPPQFLRDGADLATLSGLRDLPYAIPNLRVASIPFPLPVPTGPWRSTAYSQNTFFKEAIVDELAHAARRDPLEYRLALLPGEAHRRERRALEIVAARAGWGGRLPTGRGRGIAVQSCYGSVCAQVAEVSVAAGEVRVHRVTCAIDCGLVVNPDIVRAQIEGGILFGLSAALMGRITIADGRAEQRNFHDYPILRMNETPAIEVVIVPSDAPPGGVGEAGTPPIAPAVTNAIFVASGERIRRLPIRLHRFPS